MKINTVVELEEGKKVRFVGELEGVELEFVIQTGLNFLMYHGLLPTTKGVLDMTPATTKEEVH